MGQSEFISKEEEIKVLKEVAKMYFIDLNVALGQAKRAKGFGWYGENTTATEVECKINDLQVKVNVIKDKLQSIGIL